MTSAAATPASGDEALRDTYAPHDVARHEVGFHGLVWDVVRDVVELPGEQVTREYVQHPGAVGVLALDDTDRVLVVRQYRHPVRSYLWEVPAGLLDVDGEHPLRTAERELFEEAHHVAGRWDTLCDYYTTPGGSSEMVRIFLARDVAPATGAAYAAHGEERDMPRRWVPLDDLVAAALAGDIHNPTTCVAALAAHAFRARSWVGLRPGDEAWPQRFPAGLPPLVRAPIASLDSAATGPAGARVRPSAADTERR